MLSILILNQIWFVEYLKAKGHKVVTAGCQTGFDIKTEDICRIDDILKQLPNGFHPDRIIYFDNSYPITVLDIETCSIPSIFFSVDTHHHHYWHKILPQLFSKILVAQKDYITLFDKENADRDVSYSWFPLWANDDLFPMQQKDIDICFRGNLSVSLHPERAKFFEEFMQNIGADINTGLYQEAYPRSKIVINQNVKDDLNFRVFEAMMAGALLVTPQIENGLSNLFVIGDDLVTFNKGDAKKAAEICRYYLEHEEERERIARNGREKVLLKHNIAARGAELEKHLFDVEGKLPSPSSIAKAKVYLATALNIEWKHARTNACAYKHLLAEKISEYVLSASLDPKTKLEDIEFSLIFLKYILDSLKLSSLKSQIIKKVFSARPSSSILLLSSLDDLIKMGDEQQAISIAKTVCQDEKTASELVSNAVVLLRQLESHFYEQAFRVS